MVAAIGAVSPSPPHPAETSPPVRHSNEAEIRTRLPALDPPGWADWVVPLAAAVAWSVALSAASSTGLATVRSLVFVGGPIVLLSGLHARLTGYLHAPARLWLLPLPLRPEHHFAAARRRHLRGLAATVVWGTAALGLTMLTVGAPLGHSTFGLLGDWLWLVLVAVLVEPAIAGAAAWLGRRFDEDSWQHQLQRSLSGGWTLPEATVHLYAPAIGLGLAAALAMPGQLLTDRAVDGLSIPSGLVVAAVAGPVLALALMLLAPRLYGRGLFGAVPWLAEATRTLAGPPVPEPAPGWVRKIADPVLRLLVLQFLRQTPVPTLRLLLLVASCAFVAMAETSSPTLIAIVAGADLLWLVPARVIAQSRTARARLLAPLPSPARTGRHPLALVLLLTPAIAPWLLLLARQGGAW